MVNVLFVSNEMERLKTLSVESVSDLPPLGDIFEAFACVAAGVRVKQRFYVTQIVDWNFLERIGYRIITDEKFNYVIFANSMNDTVFVPRGTTIGIDGKVYDGESDVPFIPIGILNTDLKVN